MDLGTKKLPCFVYRGINDPRMITCLGVLLGINLTAMDDGSGDMADSNSDENKDSSASKPQPSKDSPSQQSKPSPNQSGDSSSKSEKQAPNSQVIKSENGSNHRGLL